MGKVRRVLGSKGGTREQEGLTDAELNINLIDDQNLLWLECERVGVLARKTSVFAVPQCLVPDLFALVHGQHGHPGVPRTLPLLRDRLHSPGMWRDTRDYVLSCGCRRRKWSRSQRVVMLPATFLGPWEVPLVNIQRFPNTS